MDLEERKRFNDTKKMTLWFGKAFLASKGGTAWREAKGLTYFFIQTWFDFYFGLLKRRLEVYCEELLSCSLETYDRDALSEEVSGLVRKIKEFDIPSPPPGTPHHEMNWERPYITDSFLKRHRDTLEYLFDEDIIYNAPWNDGHSGEPFVIISADNRFYKDHLLAVYTGLAEKLQGVQTKQPKATPAIQTSETAPETESRRMEKEIERLRNEIDALKKQRSDRPEEDQPEEDQLGQNLMYRMTLLYRLGLLDKSLWPKDATQDQISTVLGTILSSPQSPAKTTTVKRYLKGLVNHDYDGQKIEEKYGPRVDELLKKVFVGKDE